MAAKLSNERDCGSSPAGSEAGLSGAALAPDEATQNCGRSVDSEEQFAVSLKGLRLKPDAQACRWRAAEIEDGTGPFGAGFP